MQCERCGREVSQRHYYPGIATVTGKFKHGQWLCADCVMELAQKEAEKPSALKREWLRSVVEYKPEPQKISLQEFQEVKRKARFECPLGLIPEECDGHWCPSKLEMGDEYENPHDDYYHECVEALQARLMIHKIIRGEVRVKGFSIRLR